MYLCKLTKVLFSNFQSLHVAVGTLVCFVEGLSGSLALMYQYELANPRIVHSGFAPTLSLALHAAPVVTCFLLQLHLDPLQVLTNVSLALSPVLHTF